MTQSPKISIVILNYMNYRDTVACVDSILNQTYKNWDMVIVDNGSTNESFECLQANYNHHNNIYLLRNDKNQGFAKGNNRGIEYAVQYLSPDLVFVLNNDTMLGINTLQEIAMNDISTGTGVISPTVVGTDHKKQRLSVNADNMYRQIVEVIFELFVVSAILRLSVINAIYKKYKSKRKNPVTMVQDTDNQPKNRKYVIQGSAYLLTGNFFKYYNRLYPNTFLYWEEINLLTYLQKVNLTAIEITTDPVIHKGKQSTVELLGKEGINKKFLKFSFGSLLKSIPMFFMSYKQIYRKYNKQREI